jgi:hypothetical protein
MANKKLRGVLVDVYANKAKEIEIEDSLDELYRVCRCSCIDIPNYYIGGRKFSCVVDDEGLLKKEPIISAINLIDHQVMLVGNIFIVNTNYMSGDLVSLTDEEIKFILKNVRKLATGHIMLTNVSY